MFSNIQRYQKRFLDSFDISYKRYLFNNINFDDKMVAIFGARGVGKTTMLLQYLIELQKNNKKALYISLDYPFLSSIDLVEIVEEFAKEGGEYLLLDEVHRYRDFSLYLKTIYDLFDINVIFTGSSATSILNAKSDLSRRVTLYKLNGFSFREYLEVKYKISLKKIGLEDIFFNHIDISKEIINNNFNILKEFKIYLKYGYYPFYIQKQSSYFQNLLNTINLTIDLDLTSLGLIEQKYTYKLKRLLEVICESKPFEINYTKISTLAKISRAKLYSYISYLNDGDMLLLLNENIKGLKKITKPAKIYFNNTNLLYAYCQKPEIGTIRETFVANQLSSSFDLSIPNNGDFLIDGRYLIEVGGKNKSFNQIKDIKDSFLVIDDLEIGIDNKIPLWLFGFLY